jgi:hypothetical protein
MTRRREQVLDRDQQILSRLARIEHKVDSLEQTTAFALRAEADKHFASAKAIFRNSKRRAQVYLAANGNRGVTEIAAHLRMKRQNVTPELRALHEEGLLEIVDERGGKDIWAKKPIDRTLRITKFLCQEFTLDSDGRSGSKTRPAPRRAR